MKTKPTWYHKNNLQVILWGMEGHNEIVDALKRQPDQIITDDIELAIRITGR